MNRWPAYVVIAGASAAIALKASFAIAGPAGAQVVKSPGAIPDISTAALSSGDEEAGREAYAEDCRACHSGAIAPSLKGIAGRAIASAPGYSYSDGLKTKSAKTWTAVELNDFMSDPNGYAPGTKMMLKVGDAQKRADIIAYLQSL